MKEPPMRQEVAVSCFNAMKAEDPGNKMCFDCSERNAEWISVSFGVFLCIACSGHHRNMGTHISRIRSIKMDAWTERQLQVCRLGGNTRLNAFFDLNGIPKEPALQRYVSPAGEWYRETMRCQMLGHELPTAPPGVTGVTGARAERPDLLDFGTDLLGPTPGAVPTPVAANAGDELPDLLGLGDTLHVPAIQAPASQGPATLVFPVAQAEELDIFALSPRAPVQHAGAPGPVGPPMLQAQEDGATLLQVNDPLMALDNWGM